MKYAVINAGGHQHVVTTGTRLTLNRVAGEPGQAVEFPKLLEFTADGEVGVGKPTLAGTVKGKIVAHGRSKKVMIVKFKRKVRYRRKIGHRHPQTSVEITSL